MSDPNSTIRPQAQNWEPSATVPTRSTKCWFLIQCIAAPDPVQSSGYGNYSYNNTPAAPISRVLICLVNLDQPVEADVSNLEKLVLTAFGKDPAATTIGRLYVKDQASKTPWYTTVEQLVVYLRGEEAVWSSQVKRVPNLWESGGNEVTVVFGTKSKKA